MNMDTAHTTMDKYLSFTMSKEVFALEIAQVREVLDMAEITRIPKTPTHMRGVVNLRGNAVPVMDLKLKFGLGETESTINTRIIILEFGSGADSELAGILADSVREVLDIVPEEIDAPPKMGACVDTSYLRGVAKKDEDFVLVLDLSHVFTDADIPKMEDLDGAVQAA